MAALQRSNTSFRRQGSSGSVWDDQFFSTDLTRIMRPDKQEGGGDRRRGSAALTQRSASDGGRRHHRQVKASSPTSDPSSPKVYGCCLCRIVSKAEDTTALQRKSQKRRS